MAYRCKHFLSFEHQSLYTARRTRSWKRRRYHGRDKDVTCEFLRRWSKPTMCNCLAFSTSLSTQHTFAYSTSIWMANASSGPRTSRRPSATRATQRPLRARPSSGRPGRPRLNAPSICRVTVGRRMQGTRLHLQVFLEAWDSRPYQRL